ncbi:putative secreted protein with PEP-CTERM sorting signal [Prosthecobacter fusiformis]|uniref:Putative secreted protein with PEP-CTERM sorting signal n=1 Tax=Prosthecobacter fusiformis TaxID=48464 RepID=A0A4R7S3N1_9BACT|nr:autotransporter-associated beta strand repeat-containing protein [Prosthecobacter fusiformis]TDU72884.1 putative secreted protein with PEP-CTERM sorting signal [Prosthecobacter fusiformis]
MIFRTSLFLALLCTHLSLNAATLTWDGNISTGGLQDGTGNWDTTVTDRWYNAASVPPGYQAWNNANGDTAVFGVGSGAAGTVTLTTAITAGGLTFNTPGSGTYVLSGNTLTLAGTPIIAANAAVDIKSILAGTAGFTKNGTGNLTLSGADGNTLTGKITVSGGTLTTAKSVNVDAINDDIEVTTGGTFVWGANNQIDDAADVIISGGTITFGSRNETIGSYTQTSGGMSSNNNSGIIDIKGTLAISGGNTLTINSRGQWSAHTVDFTGYVGASSTTAVLVLGSDNASTVTRLSVGEGGLKLSGQILKLNRTANSTFKGSELLLGGNVTATGVNSITYNEAVTLGAAAVNQVNMGNATRTWTINGDDTSITTVELAIVGAGGLTKAGTGTLVLGGIDHNTYAGVTTVSAGRLTMKKSAGFNATGDILVNGGTLSWGNSDQIPDTATITVTSGPMFMLGRFNEVFANYVQTGGTGFASGSNNAGVVEITGTATLSGGGTLTVNSGGTMTINQLNATGFSGTLLNIGGNNTSRVTSLTIGPGGMTLSGQNITIAKGPDNNSATLGSELILKGTLTATGNNNFNLTSGSYGVAQINLGTGQRTFAINSGTTTTNLPMVGSGGVIKTGAGILQFNVASTYTGKTTVSGGSLTLAETGSIASSNWIQVDAGAVFNVGSLTSGFTYAPTSGTKIISGSGSITGDLHIGGVAQLRPGTTSDNLDISTAGDGIGTLSISGDLSFDADAPTTVAQLQILNASAADKITIGGDLKLTADTFLSVTFDDDYVPMKDHSWTLIDWAGLLDDTGFLLGTNNRTGRDLDNNEGNLNLPDLTEWGLLWDIGAINDGGSLVVTIVPEPSRALLLGLGFFWLGWRRRR